MNGTRLPFDPAELAMLHGTGFFGVPAGKLEEIAEEVRHGEPLFDAAWSCGIDPANLTDADIRTIRELAREESD